MIVSATPRLRPLGMGQLLDQAIRLYRRNFLKFIGIIAIAQIPFTVLQLGMSLLAVGSTLPQLQDPTAPPSDLLALLENPILLVSAIAGFIVLLIGFLLIQVVATAALTRAVAGNYLGESMGIIDAYRKIGHSWVSLIGAFILAFFLGILLVIWFLVPCVGWLTGLGILIFYSMVVAPLIAPAIVLERQPASYAIRRAWDLARRRFWWVLGFMFILYIFGQIIIAGPAYLISIVFQLVVGSPFDVSVTQTIIQSMLQSVVQLLSSLIYLPLQLTAVTLMYFDLRIRTEGFDLTLLSESVTGSQIEVGEITARAPQPEQSNFVTMNEMGYFVLVSMGGVVVLFIFWMIGAIFGLAMLAASGAPGF
jgi:hypothetical protein